MSRGSRLFWRRRRILRNCSSNWTPWMPPQQQQRKTVAAVMMAVTMTEVVTAKCEMGRMLRVVTPSESTVHMLYSSPLSNRSSSPCGWAAFSTRFILHSIVDSTSSIRRSVPTARRRRCRGTSRRTLANNRPAIRAGRPIHGHPRAVDVVPLWCNPAEEVDTKHLRVIAPAENASLFLNFSYVCPEPVLVKRSFFVSKWLKRGVVRTRARCCRRIHSGCRHSH